jgi:iron complex outermembrane receptor protein
LVPNPTGQLIETQQQSANAFQPKIQAAYHLDSDLMVYLTWSKGFRAGYFNTANFSQPERTENYEAGFKATLLEGRMVLNGAAFHIKYSNQQFSAIISGPPFRIPVTIPETSIKGGELEASMRITGGLTFSSGLGYLRAIVANGTRSPLSPTLTANAQLDWMRPIMANLNFHANATYSHSGSMYLGAAQSYPIPGTDFVNLRIGVERDRWRATAFVRNLADERQVDFAPAVLGNGLAIGQSRPRSYGVEFATTF